MSELQENKCNCPPGKILESGDEIFMALAIYGECWLRHLNIDCPEHGSKYGAHWITKPQDIRHD